jgi:lysosomal alpha-glucosidase
LTSIGPQYNTHALYGYLETISTYKALVAVTKKRPFIITRSSFPGTGTMAGKWSGDNFSTWDDLFNSISSILTFNIFGIPFIGADVCGFGDDATEELCVRWHQLGSFYPFARNHNAIHKRSQEPYAFGPLLIETSRSALLNRYSLLPYYYTLFYNVHVNGGTVIKSLPFEFNNDNDQHINFVDKQFLVGSGLLISPVLSKGANKVHMYLPPSEIWYNYWTGAPATQKGWFDASVTIRDIPIHIRGGYIIPRQEPGLTTTESRKKPFFLNVALDKDGVSNGDLYLDDG